ncbi:MAG TPA: glutathione S-transferase family protein [Steroidobacteraceae bacterium]|nr:glutathione S-transferase family protein [Steroidobacteraceae bacterium]
MLILYHNAMSSSSQKVRLCLAEKALPWESKPINLGTGEHQEEWYRRLNPRAVVPTLIDGEALQESTVINEYLEARYPAPKLLPDDPMAAARVRLWTKQIDESIHDGCIAVLAFGIAFREQALANRDATLRQLEKVPDVIKRERRRDVFESGLQSIHVKIGVLRLLQLFHDMDEALAQTEWLAGSNYTLADIAIMPYLTRLDDLNLAGLWDRWPRVGAWFERCRKRPSYDDAITGWNVAPALQMMKQGGARDWPRILAIASEA